jgi:hypothetical protein
MSGKNRIMIYGPKDDGTYVVEFMTSEGDVLAISIPRTEAHVMTSKSGCLRVICAGCEPERSSSHGRKSFAH